MEEYLQFAKDLAYQAGDVMLRYFKIGVAQQTKADATPVTLADMKINQLVISAVREVFPSHRVLGEEESGGVSDAEYVWVCDPIDGTQAYAIGVPTNMFSLALVHLGKPIVAVMYDPYLDRLYIATKDSNTSITCGGATHPLRVSEESVLARSRVTLPAWKIAHHNTGEILTRLIDQNVQCFSTLSTTYEAALVASGQTAGQVYFGTASWDIAAASLIIEKAGGKVTSLSGNSIKRFDVEIPNGAVMSNGHIHEVLIAALHDASSGQTNL